MTFRRAVGGSVIPGPASEDCDDQTLQKLKAWLDSH
jgi:hypothetical protein